MPITPLTHTIVDAPGDIATTLQTWLTATTINNIYGVACVKPSTGGDATIIIVYD